MLSCLFIAALWSPAGKGLTSWLSYACDVLLCFGHFPVWCPRLCVVSDCIDFLSLLPYLLCYEKHAFSILNKIKDIILTMTEAFVTLPFMFLTIHL